jgi:hypothetical protein
MSPFGNPSALGFLPVTAIEEASRFEARPVYAVETERVDCDAVRLGARHIERVHPAMQAKCVLGHTRTECIGGQRVLAAQQFEILRCHRQVEDALLCADGAIAL